MTVHIYSEQVRETLDRNNNVLLRDRSYFRQRTVHLLALSNYPITPIDLLYPIPGREVTRNEQASPKASNTTKPPPFAEVNEQNTDMLWPTSVYFVYPMIDIRVYM